MRRRYLTIPLVFCLSLQLSGLNLVRVESNVDAAIAKYGVTGKGVLVAVMDRGIDWTNNDFRNADGSTRIAGIFDLTDDTGAHANGNPYGMGTLYTRDQIDAALVKGPALATRDAVGHGTATAGIAAGNGRNSFQSKYRGIAPNATLLIIKVITEGAPAHDNQPAEAAFYDPNRVPVAIDYARSQAAALKMPCVMLADFGMQNGPTDGTSFLSRKIDATVGPNIPGLIFVTGTGDDNGIPNRASGILSQNSSQTIQIQKAPGPLTFDLWYYDTDRIDVSVLNQAGFGAFYTAPVSENDIDTEVGNSYTYTQYGSNVTLYGSHNGKREINLQMNGGGGIFTVILRARSVVNGRFDATLSPSQFWNAPYSINFLMNAVTNGSIWDGATAFYNIAPNAYNIRTTWTDIDGNPRALNPTSNGNVGEIWPGSSVGPTFDKRLGVDVSAPGELVVTAYNPNSYWATMRNNLIDDGHGLYGMEGGSAAGAPIVAGIIALMLELNPTLDASTVKFLLQNNARSDAFATNLPNATWGFGKVDALKVLDAVSKLVPVGMSLSRKSLNFGTTSDASLITSPQNVDIAFSAGPSVAWTATASSPNIIVKPSSGSGNKTIQISVLGPGGSGSVLVSAPGATNSPQLIQVNIATVTPTTPFGSFDTPANNASNIAGAIPISGWALDNIEVSTAAVWRDPVGNEVPQGNGLVFIGNATFVNGARPDVETAYPNAPLNYRAGFGYLLLTNFLPNNSTTASGPGNGAYRLHVILTNKAGTSIDLGARTINVDNAHATKPFGTIDSPDQGGTAGTSQFTNFGWALTPMPAAIPVDGSTIFVTVDGVTLGHPVYGNFRPDIFNAFPGYANTNGAIGYYFLDTTKLTNGVHTIGWLVYDNLNRGDGIGSRFFTVSNGTTSAAPDEPIAESTSGVTLRRDIQGPAERLRPAKDGEYSVDMQQLGRVELNVGAQLGYLLVRGERRPLPVGSTLKGGTFYWQPPAGFLGTYDLLFHRPDGGVVRVHIRLRP